MAIHRWLTLAAAILIAVLEAWSFTAASAVTTAASATNLSNGRYERSASGHDGARTRPAQVAGPRARLKQHP